MTRAAIVMMCLCGMSMPAQADWTVAGRIDLPLSGEPIDLANLARGDEETVRIVLVGTYTFLHDGSEIDALGSSLSDRRDESLAMVALPVGAQLVDEDAIAHRYTFAIPRAASMPISLRVAPLAMRHLITASEARANLQGSIQLEHLVPPPPPPPAMAVALEEASSVPVTGWLAGLLGLSMLGGLGFWSAKRRRDPIVALVARARRARSAIARECAALGPAFDPVSASAARLLEATEETAAHDRAMSAAIARTAWTSAESARASMKERAFNVRARLRELVARLEHTATQLAGQRADSARAKGVEALVDELDADLEAASYAEEELARIA